MSQAPQKESPAEALARSAFGFALFALIPAIITWIFFWLAPLSPSPTFRAIRWGIIAVFGIMLLCLLWLTRYFYRTPAEKFEAQASTVTRFFGQTPIAIVATLLLIEMNIIGFLVFRGIASSITNPTKFLLICWSLLLVGIIFIANREKFQVWYEKTQGLWVSTGLVVVGIIVFAGLFAVSSWLIHLSGVNDILRGGLDYRQLEFYDDGNPAPSASAFWAEQAQTSVRWSPYTYWVMSEFDGDYINIASDGLRHTPNYGGELDIFIFGGSTVWGEGARDDYTIPAHLARLLDEQDNPQNVVNYGQTGFVSSQDLIWFQRQLTRGNVPDVAIFYQGFNDILSAWGTGLTGVTLQEEMRLNDSEAGRRLRAGQAVLRLPNQSLTQYDMTSAGVISATPERIAELWLANVEMVSAIAEAYEVEVLFVWQPAIIFKDSLSESEQAIYQRSDTERAGLFALYNEVDAIVRERVEADNIDNVIILSDLFADNTDPIFHDLVHITEIGNGIVAEAILPHLRNLLEN